MALIDILISLSHSILYCGFIGNLFSTAFWWGRIRPWFNHGDAEGHRVYQCTLACWILSLIGTLIIGTWILCPCCAKTAFSKVNGNMHLRIGTFIFITLLASGTFITGIIASSYALQNNPNGKCGKYLDTGISGVLNWLQDHPNKVNDFQEWLSRKATTSYSYYCQSVGIPTFVFSLILGVGIIFYLTISIITSKQDDNDNNHAQK